MKLNFIQRRKKKNSREKQNNKFQKRVIHVTNRVTSQEIVDHET